MDTKMLSNYSLSIQAVKTWISMLNPMEKLHIIMLKYGIIQKLSNYLKNIQKLKE